jgi:hypothetical protein
MTTMMICQLLCLPSLLLATVWYHTIHRRTPRPRIVETNRLQPIVIVVQSPRLVRDHTIAYHTETQDTKLWNNSRPESVNTCEYYGHFCCV